MSVDLEAIAQRGRCDVSSLRLAIPLLEQGYSPPFLARYRRDELGGLDESSLWELASAVQTEQQVQSRREELHDAWQQTSLCDPAIGNAIKKSNSLRMLNRLGRRLKHETGDAADDATRLAVRVLNPQKGDDADLSAIAESIDGITNLDLAVSGVDSALAHRLAGDPRMVAAAVRWLAKNAKIRIATIHDPHIHSDSDTAPESGDDANPSESQETKSVVAAPASEPAPIAPEQSAPQSAAEVSGTDVVATEVGVKDEATANVSDVASESGAADLPATDAGVEASTPSEAESSVTPAMPTEGSPNVADPGEPQDAAGSAGDPVPPVEDGSAEETSPPGEAGGQLDAVKNAARSGKGKRKTKSPVAKQASKKQKKVSPRQRRRRWLVGVLKPLEGKRFASDKLSAFQIVMLGRALRSQVAQCSFEYDATKLVAELQRTAGSINRNFEPQLRQIVLDHEADIREAAEAAWWDDLHEKASSRLVTITADHLRRHINRGAVEAKVVMAIDAVGPRTAATSIVCADGRILHNEDLPCQLSAAMRSQAVARMGELIHSYHVDLIVISNGPARRATMIALGDLIAQSPDKSVRWTLADRSGADVYAGSAVADEEMRTTPRRFRAAAWLAFSVLQPAQALAKIDPLKLRLSSFQRELSDDAMSGALEDVMISGASRGGVDVNSAPVSWLVRLPGVTSEVAQAIDSARRTALFSSREMVGSLEQWSSVAGSRQALPFLRVFGSEEVLDGTLIHPDDYGLARKLATALGIELPPTAPPGYEPPDFSEPHDPTAKVKIAEAPLETKPAVVEDFSSAGDRARDFSVEETSAESVASNETVATDSSDDGAPSATSEVPRESDANDPSATASDAVEAEASEADASSGEPSAETDAETQSGDADAADNVAPEAKQSDVVETTEPTTKSISRDDLPEPVRRDKPERAKIDKCVKEWQIGARRAHQLVQWLCDPFGDSDSSGISPAVLTTIPSSKSLREGDMVIGVVVGVMPFGVFVELAPDCSGLIHVSRVSDSYVEDLHEAVQVGDVVTAWVTGIDEKRRRVALTAISPEREAELEEARRARDHRSRQSGPRSGGRVGGRSRGAGDASPPARAAAGQSQGAGGQARGGQTRGGQGRGGQARGAPGRDPQSRGDSQGRGGRGSRGGKRQHDSRSGGRARDKKPESYRVVSKAEATPISDAMQKGEEPLRSFGDLLQFFGKSTSSKPDSEPPQAQEPKQATDAKESAEPAGPDPKREEMTSDGGSEATVQPARQNVDESTVSRVQDHSNSEAASSSLPESEPSSLGDKPAS